MIGNPDRQASFRSSTWDVVILTFIDKIIFGVAHAQGGDNVFRAFTSIFLKIQLLIFELVPPKASGRGAFVLALTFTLHHGTIRHVVPRIRFGRKIEQIGI